MPSCNYRRDAAFGIDSDVCGATARFRFTSTEDSWLQQYACPIHRQPLHERLKALHSDETIVEEKL